MTTSIFSLQAYKWFVVFFFGLFFGNYVAMWLLNYSGCGTFRDFESDIFTSILSLQAYKWFVVFFFGLFFGNYVAMWLLNYSGCGTFRDFESDIFMNFRLWVSLL